ncbi:MAG: protein translocase SEC61 complex subunit gamma [Candidatus Methanodesulfokora sp.]|jgi:protein translocase SEC61 complex gamma subunit|nr:MAG: protein translocase SEC61 complex subunit gamma [Candidatus Korarchaeota archaeon]
MSEKLKSFWEDVKRTIKVASKPTYDEIWQMFKITIIGFLIVGLIGFVFQLAGSLMAGAAHP